MTLFRAGNFRLHSGDRSRFLIDCLGLSDDDLKALAEIVSEQIAFRAVQGVPNGGIRFANALLPYASGEAEHPLLIVDDVLTTGASMNEARDNRPTIGLVLFARTEPPPWVRALFRTGDLLDA